MKLLFLIADGMGGWADEHPGGKTCLEASAEAMTRALAQSLAASPRKSPQTARALVELVCGTGCDDAVSRLPTATRQEFTEAFCD